MTQSKTKSNKKNMKHSLIKRKLGRVEKAVDKSIEKAEIPGAVIIARMPREDEVLDFECVRGHAVLQPERLPMTRETVFDLASLTKPMATTAAIMLLVKDGLLTLDDPVAKVLPAFGDRDKEAVTLRHLLSHSSGLKPWRAFHELMIKKESKMFERVLGTAEGREWIIDRVIRSGLVHEPGEAAVYGDLDFIALGAVVEAVTKQSLDAFCAERIYAPLEMKDTGFLPLPVDGSSATDAVPAAMRRRIAATENCPWRDRIIWGEVHDPNAAAMGGVAGHAGLFSTADDVMIFARAMVDGWHGRSELFPQPLMHEFFARQKLPQDSDWALGWDTPTAGGSSSGELFSENSVGHLGFTGTSVWIDLEREAIVVMLTNRVHLVAKRSHFDLRPKLHDFIIDAFIAN